MTAPAIRPGLIRFVSWLLSKLSWGVEVSVGEPGDWEPAIVEINVDV